MAIIELILVGGPKSLRDQRGEWISSIARTQIDGKVPLSKSGFAGDKVAQSYHGGADAAVCVHLTKHYDFWRDQYGVGLNKGHLGENLVLRGLEESQICAGDIVQIGSATVQVSGPRIPCETQTRRAGRCDWVKLTIHENRTGFYLRVLEEGSVQAGDEWQLRERCHPEAAIPALNDCFYLHFDPDGARQFSSMSRLAEWWRDQFRQKIERNRRHWSEDILVKEAPSPETEAEANRSQDAAPNS